jgi:hypothetical protein
LRLHYEIPGWSAVTSTRLPGSAEEEEAP